MGGEGSGVRGHQTSAAAAAPHVAMMGGSASWLQGWTFGVEGKSSTQMPKLPPPEVVSALGKARSTESQILYRAHSLGKDSSPLESWTSQREMAQTMVENPAPGDKRILLTRRVHPSEIVTEVSKLPAHIGEAHGLPGEVIVANGGMARRLVAIRGEALVKGQQWSGKAKAIERDYKKYGK